MDIDEMNRFKGGLQVDDIVTFEGRDGTLVEGVVLPTNLKVDTAEIKWEDGKITISPLHPALWEIVRYEEVIYPLI